MVDHRNNMYIELDRLLSVVLRQDSFECEKVRKLRIDVVPIPVRNCELYPGRLNLLPPFPRIGEQMRRPTRQRWSSPQRTVHRFAHVCLITSSLESCHQRAKLFAPRLVV